VSEVSPVSPTNGTKPKKRSPRRAPDSDSDIVWGANQIAPVVNLTPSQVRYLVRMDLLPVTWVGNRMVGSKRKLLAAVGGA
jgi:hypothetical protein